MKKVVHIGVFSFAKFQVILGIIIGSIFGVLYAFGGLGIDVLVSLGWINSKETAGLSYGTLLAFGALIGMPIIGLIAGVLKGVIEAVLYNFLSKRLKRIRFLAFS